MAEVLLKDVCKSYGGGVEAVINLNLRCEEGEFVCLLGPSGCGKSSTLRMIAGLERITSGELYIGDRLVNDLSPRERNIAMVFETYALYSHVSVYENIAFPLKIRKYSKTEIDKEVKSVAELLDISDILNRKIKGLSDGQKQRVSIGRALVRKPDVLLMDEPISHVDIQLRTRLRGELKRIQRETMVTCIYVTHDQIEAMALADKIAVMNLGKLQQVGSPDELYNNPINEFVAGFIGEPPINFLDCEIVEEKNSLCLKSPSLLIELPKSIAKKVREGNMSEVKIGIRPSDVNVLKTEPEDTHNVFKCIVDVIEPQGDEIISLVKLPKGEELRILLKATFKVEEGNTIWLEINPDKVHIFEKTSGMAVS